jgi:hypothetical protein
MTINRVFVVWTMIYALHIVYVNAFSPPPIVPSARLRVPLYPTPPGQQYNIRVNVGGADTPQTLLLSLQTRLADTVRYYNMG